MSEETVSQNEPYRVLARKYRPQSFDELIGQEALVRTLTNAIESGRIAHAFMLTGVRGVGKTTTARIIAKALNHSKGATAGDTSDCPICQAISEDRHPDVIEMDAASRTGVDDIREILDGVRYAPTEARYKIYVIDEVHMLSKNAFNALLKTLEEPPEHVKFIFATTEIRKVPVTVLSRCQRFDLRRVGQEELAAHFVNLCGKENVEAEEGAIAQIAQAADGSVRDGLSLLDQAIALSGDKITAEGVADMLGLSDRARGLDLLEKALGGAMAEALDIMDDLYKGGADPVVVVQDLLDMTHLLTKLRAVPEAAQMKQALSADQVERASGLAKDLSMPTLSKAWQILLKGLSEVQAAPNPQSAAEMVLIRLAYAADLPDPGDLLKRLKDGSGAVSTGSGGASQPSPSGAAAPVTASAAGSSMTPASPPPPPPVKQGERAALAIVPKAEPVPVRVIKTLEDVVAVLEEAGEVLLAGWVYQYVHLVKLEAGLIEFRPDEAAPSNLAQDLSKKLSAVDEQRWIVSVSGANGQPTLAQAAQAAQEAEMAEVIALPIMKEVLSVFPDAEVTAIKTIETEGNA